MRILLLLLLLTLPLLADPQHEPFGPVKLGMKEAAVVKAIGAPAKRSKPIVEGATGLTASTLSWPHLGLQLTMTREKASDPWVIDRIHAQAPCKFKTSKGVGIGDTLDTIRVKYTLGGEDAPTDTVMLGDAYGGLIFNLKKGKVTSIFLGAAAE